MHVKLCNGTNEHDITEKLYYSAHFEDIANSYCKDSEALCILIFQPIFSMSTLCAPTACQN